MYDKGKLPKMGDKGRKSSFETMKDPKHMDAKMSVLEELRGMAMQMMGEKVAPDEIDALSISKKPAGELQEQVDLSINVLPDDVHDTASAMGTPDSAQYSDEDDAEIEEVRSMLQELEANRARKMRGED